jgi:hypothetical protein
MKLYSSFLIRCWLISDLAEGERPVIEVEHIQTGGHTRAASLAEAELWMFEACRTTRAPAGAFRDTELERDRL